jgi:predicted NUDIX family NTP pyrophosphohydrolase
MNRLAAKMPEVLGPARYDENTRAHMPKLSAGILAFRKRPAGIQVFLVHPGGPFWKNKDAGAWSIPKGEYAEGTDPLEAAKREFLEETGSEARGEFICLDRLRQSSGKVISAWALERDSMPPIRSNTFSMEWPPKSGRMQEFPEVDRGDWFFVNDARKQIVKGQIGFIDRLIAHLSR